jgi:hypothetical protein
MCLADSGNVAELVNRLDCGEVFRTVDELMNHFETMRATEYSNVVRRKRYTIKSIGTSATIQAAGTERGHEIGNE